MTTETDRTVAPQRDPSPARALRVLTVVHRFLPELGGTETHVAEVSRRLAVRDDLDVTILTTDRSGELPVRDEVNGVPVIRERAWPRRRDYYLSPGVFARIRQGDWDLIHFQGVHTLIPPTGMLAARSARIPYVLTFHSGGSSAPGRTAIRGTQWRVLAPLLRRAAGLIAVSRFERERFAAATGIDPARFEVIGNGGALPPVAEERIRPGRIVSSGRLEKYKGHHHAIAALPLVRRQIPDAELLILGAGPYEGELRELAGRLGVGDAVEIRHLPPADRAAMAGELARSAVMAALSSYEAHPVGVMEAVASGLPVLGFDIAGIGDLVADGLVTGLDPAAGPAAVAAALVSMLQAQDPAATRVRPDVELPTWESCAERVAEVYHRVAAGSATSVPGTPR